MKHRRQPIKIIELLAVMAFLLAINLPVEASVQLPNPSFDEDAANIGTPDGWVIHPKASVSLVTDKVSHGAKAAKFTEGYVLLSCDMNEENIAGLKLEGSIDAAGSDGAKLGIMFGFNIQQDGKTKFIYSRPVWDRKLEGNYQKITFACKIPDNAVKQRIWFGVYRSNSTGTVWLDNAALHAFRNQKLNPEELARQTALSRDWKYLQQRAETVSAKYPENQALITLKKEISDNLAAISKLEKNISDLETELQPRLDAGAALINKISNDSSDNITTLLCDPYVRIEPGASMPVEKQNRQLLSLGGEYQALGLTVSNNLPTPQHLTLTVSGLDAAIAGKPQVRRQVLMMNWYEREKALTADPLTLLQEKNGSYELSLDPGEIMGLYIGFKVKNGVSGTFPVTLQVGDARQTAELKVIARDFPAKQPFSNLQCIYPEQGAPGKYPDLAAKDLAEHYTTAMEFPYIPSVVFNPDGSIKSKDFKGGRHDRWMKAYASQNITLALFWEGFYKRFPVVNNGKREVLPFIGPDNRLTPEWSNAYVNLLKAWLDFAKSQGFGIEHFQMWAMDELASRDEFANPPGTKVKIGIDIYDLTRKHFPDLPLMVTAGNYTLPQDIRAYVGHVDIVNQAWPMPEKLFKWTPKGYKPREEFLNNTLSFLKEIPSLTLGSYRVDAGKKESVLASGRAYPLCAAGLGFSGVGTWAYNCSRGLTWDDTDKGLLDYIMVYDGTEEHPLNRRYNVTGELIVPSIRWEAMRMGIQDAKILLWLKSQANAGKLSPAATAEIQKISDTLEEFGRNLNYTNAAISNISHRLRELAGELQ